MMKVWCKVKEQETEKVKVAETDDVDDLKNIILRLYPDMLEARSAGEVSVFRRGVKLSACI